MQRAKRPGDSLDQADRKGSPPGQADRPKRPGDPLDQADRPGKRQSIEQTEYGVTFVEHEQEDGLKDVTILRAKDNTIPSSFYQLGDRPWKTIVIDEASLIDTLKDGCLRQFGFVESIVLPDSITSMDGNIFLGCEKLKSVRLPAFIEKIEKFSFRNCSNLQEINIPQNVTEIGYHAFERCNSLENIFLPEGLRLIEQYGFGACQSLQTIVLPESLQQIGRRAFSRCTSLTEITIPENCREVETSAFRECTNLKRARIMAKNFSLQSIFVDCYELESLQVVAGLTFTDSHDFSGCRKLSEFYLFMDKGDINAVNRTIDSAKEYTWKKEQKEAPESEVKPFAGTQVAYLTLEFLDFRTLGGERYRLNNVKIPSNLLRAANPNLNKLLVAKGDEKRAALERASLPYSESVDEVDVLFGNLMLEDIEDEAKAWQDLTDENAFKIMAAHPGSLDANLVLSFYEGQDSEDSDINLLRKGQVDLSTLVIVFLFDDEVREVKRRAREKLERGKAKRLRETAMAGVMIQHIL